MGIEEGHAYRFFRAVPVRASTLGSMVCSLLAVRSTAVSCGLISTEDRSRRCELVKSRVVLVVAMVRFQQYRMSELQLEPQGQLAARNNHEIS